MVTIMTRKAEYSPTIVQSFTKMKLHFCVLILLAFWGIHSDTFSQVLSDSTNSSHPSILFSGTSRLIYQDASGIPPSSSIKKQFVRWECQPTLSVFEIPVGAHILLTSENDEARSSMNSVVLFFDVKAFQKMLRERVMAKAKSTLGDYKAKAMEMKEKLSDPSSLQDVSRYDELRNKDSLTTMTPSEKEELQLLETKTKEARKMAEDVKKYESMNPKQMAKEKEKELKSLSREIADPSKLEDKLKELDIISGGEKLLFGIKNFGIGVTYPHLSPWLMTGVTVNGVFVEYQYGLINVAGATGAMNSPIPDGRTAIQTFNRNVFAGKIGMGTNEGSHLHLLGLYASDKESASLQDSAYAPAKNYVFEADCLVDLFNRGLILKASGAGSMYTRDVTAPSIAIESSNDPTGLDIFTKLDPKISSTVDYAWKIGAEFNLFGESTRGKVLIQKIGPGYTSLGVPFLRSDVMGQEAELQQDILDGQIRAGGYYKHNQDNILPWKRTLVGNTWVPSRTVLTSYGGTLDLSFADVPYLRLEYAPYLQQTDIDTTASGIKNNTTLITATLGYDYQLSTLSASTIAVVLAQNGSTDGGGIAFHNNVYTLNQSLTFEFPMMISVGGGYSEISVLTKFISIASINSSISYKFSEVVKSSVGMNYSDRNDGGSRFGFTANSKVKFLGNNEIEFRLDNNTYDSGTALDSSYDQLRLRISLLNKW